MTTLLKVRAWKTTYDTISICSENCDMTQYGYYPISDVFEITFEEYDREQLTLNALKAIDEQMEEVEKKYNEAMHILEEKKRDLLSLVKLPDEDEEEIKI